MSTKDIIDLGLLSRLLEMAGFSACAYFLAKEFNLRLSKGKLELGALEAVNERAGRSSDHSGEKLDEVVLQALDEYVRRHPTMILGKKK